MKKKSKVALITGVTGQDGSYLAEFLLKKNYIVYGGRRRSSSVNSSHRIDPIFFSKYFNKKFFLRYLDLTDSSNIHRVLQEIKPDEVYNLAAQSHVGVSFEQPEYTSNVNALGTLRLLESIKSLNLINRTRFYQASSSEMYGDTNQTPQDEKTKFNPDSPYGISKLFAHQCVVNYRESYGMYACNGILFNHESPRRGEFFVTRKIINGLIKIKLRKSDCLYLGNINSKRDWGHAKEYVEMQWKMMQKKIPDDYVIATGKQLTVKDFIQKVGSKLGMKICFFGKNLNEKGVDLITNKTIIKIKHKYFRPNDVTNLVGNSKKAKRILGWKPRISIDELISEMIMHDMELVKKS